MLLHMVVGGRVCMNSSSLVSRLEHGVSRGPRGSDKDLPGKKRGGTAAAAAAPRARGYLFISGPQSAYNGAAVSRTFCRRRRRRCPSSFFSRQIFVVWEGSRDGLELADLLLEQPR